MKYNTISVVRHYLFHQRGLFQLRSLSKLRALRRCQVVNAFFVTLRLWFWFTNLMIILNSSTGSNSPATHFIALQANFSIEFLNSVLSMSSIYDLLIAISGLFMSISSETWTIAVTVEDNIPCQQVQDKSLYGVDGVVKLKIIKY